MSKLKNIIKEPLLLFFLSGIISFILYTTVTNSIERNNKKIAISKTQVTLLEESFKKTWNRTPTQNELNAQIENMIMDEIFYKQAVAMGLDKTDLAVKKRLRQLMEMMLEDYTTINPTEIQLRKYLSENPDKFRKEPRISFRHLYFPFEKKEEAIALLKTLQNSNPLEENSHGYPVMIPSVFKNESKIVIINLFGNGFAKNITELETDIWHGPFESAYGWHLVKINEQIKGELPDLNEIWDKVEQVWSFERKREMREEIYEIMKKEYEITIERI